MKQDISYRVMKVNRWNDEKYNSVVYEVACDCSDPEHSQTIIIEHDPRLNMSFIQFWANLRWSKCWVDDDKWYKHLWWRMKGAWGILTKGSIEMQSDFVVRGKEHMDSLIGALEEGRGILKEDMLEEGR